MSESVTDTLMWPLKSPSAGKVAAPAKKKSPTRFEPSGVASEAAKKAKQKFGAALALKDRGVLQLGVPGLLGR